MLIDDPVKDEGMIRGDLLPFEELFKLHHRKVYAVCLRMIGNTTEAEDLTQEVLVQVFRKLATFRGESAFTTWLLHKARMKMRRLLRQPTRATTSPGVKLKLEGSSQSQPTLQAILPLTN